MRSITMTLKAFSLLEVLAAVAVTMTVASVVVISAKQTLQASQRSAVQRELQTLNTALNNYMAAGGVIDKGASAAEALAELKRGTDVGDADYAPLVSDPDLSKTIDG